MSVPSSGNVTLTGINTVFGKATGFSLASYASSNTYDVTTGTGSTLAVPITMRSSFLNKTPLGKVAKPNIVVTENATVAAGTLTNCVSISWSAPAGATPTGYTVQVSTDGTTFTGLSTPTSTSTTHTPTSNITYWYRVRATTATANGAWSPTSGAAVFPYQTTTPTFTPPTTTTYITFTGACGGVGYAASDLLRTYGIRFSGLQVLSTMPTYTMSFGSAGGQKNAGTGFTPFYAGFFYLTGGSGGYGHSTSTGGGGGASVIGNSTGYLIVGGGGGQGDIGRGHNGGGPGGSGTITSSGVAGTDGSTNDVVGGTGAGRGGAANGTGGAGGSGANANGYAGTSASLAANTPVLLVTTVTVGSGGQGVTNGTWGGGGGGGGYGGGGGGAAASNDFGWGGQYFAGGGGGGSSRLSPTNPFASTPTSSSMTSSYISSGWAYAIW